MTKEGYETYKQYLALQRHFSTNYDYFKYNGKVNASTDAYSKRTDMFAFEKMIKIIPESDRIDFFVTHFLENPKCWIRSMSKSNLDVYKAKIKNFPTKFREDLEYLVNFSLPELMKVENDIPEIHKIAINGKIDIETLIAVDKFYPFIEKHAKTCTVPFVWPDHITKLQNYRPFFVQKVNDFHKDIMKDVFLNK